MLKKGRLGHYLYDTERGHSSDRERSVYSCSECSCILNVRMTPGGTASDTTTTTTTAVGTGASLGDRCPGCGSSLEARAPWSTSSSSIIPEARCEISRSVAGPAPMERRPRLSPSFSSPLSAAATVDTIAALTTAERFSFRTAASLRRFAFNFEPLDALVGHFIDPSWSVVFTGRCANLISEFLCFRAQLPREAGGTDSSVVLIDGGNRSDLYLFSSFAKLYGVTPKKALARVVTSRAFTVYQLANLVVRELTKVIDAYGARVVLLADSLGVMREESGLRDDEATRLAQAIRCGIDCVRREKRVLTFVTLVTETKYDSVMTDDADVLVDFQDRGPCIKGTLVKHPLRRRPSSQEFSVHDLLFHNKKRGEGEEREKIERRSDAAATVATASGIEIGVCA
jgi:hypothetical protein